MRAIAILLACSAMMLSGGVEEQKEENYVPEEGYVPNEEVAIKIAVAVWEPIYGAEKIAAEKPYTAKLSGGVWTVEGSMPDDDPHRRGGVALAKISKSDGRIIRVIHGK